MSVFDTGPYRITERSDVTVAAYGPFLEELETIPTPEKLDQLLRRYPRFDLAQGQRCEWTALAVAISKKSLPLLHRILELRPDLLNKSCYYRTAGRSPLSLAAGSEDAEFSLRAVEELLARGADVNLADFEGVTSLFNSALRADHIAVTRALLESGGVIYEAARAVSLDELEKRIDGRRRYVDVIAEQPANIAAALATLEGVSRFAQGRLYDHPAHPMNRLPLVLCKEIASFVVDRTLLADN